MFPVSSWTARCSWEVSHGGGDCGGALEGERVDDGAEDGEEFGELGFGCVEGEDEEGGGFEFVGGEGAGGEVG